LDKLYISTKELANEIAKITTRHEAAGLGPIAKLLVSIAVIGTMLLLVPVMLFWFAIFLVYIPFAWFDNWIFKNSKRIK
jgi:hypothetical protein